MEEIWKDIKGYEGLYQISNLGRVKSLDKKIYCGHKKSSLRFTKEKIMKTQINNFGYEIIKLSKDGKSKIHFLHRIIAIHFIKNYYNKPFVNHIDGNKKNNDIRNLEWCTSKENSVHAAKNNLFNPLKGEGHSFSKLKNNDIKNIRFLYKQGKTQNFIAKSYNVSQKNISEIVNFKTWKEV